MDDDRAILTRMGLLREGEEPELTPLTGGVSSDIRLVRVGDRAFVLKRALGRLRVEAEWHAPLERGAAEARWLRYVATVVPEAVPAVLATDAETFAVALDYLPPGDFPNWKEQLLGGLVDVGFAASVGRMLGRIHAASAATPGLAAGFANQAQFESLRIEPYLRRTALAVPEVADAIADVIGMLGANPRALVHGDVSPKNILVGASSPVLLDAECATWGDPAFDVAFCLNHLELKAVHLPPHAANLARAAGALRRAYLDLVDWEPAAELDERISRCLPALQLARVAGASPAEYLTPAERRTVRDRAVSELVTHRHPRKQ